VLTGTGVYTSTKFSSTAYLSTIPVPVQLYRYRCYNDLQPSHTIIFFNIGDIFKFIFAGSSPPPRPAGLAHLAPAPATQRKHLRAHVRTCAPLPMSKVFQTRRGQPDLLPSRTAI
jgi:hypothetical protein